jgi:type II secretory pathway pseudopilin PulG
LRVQRANAPTRQRANGFTLVEVLIVTVLLFVLGGGLLSTFLTGQTSFLSGELYVQVQQEARRAFDVMVRELREAKVSTASVVAGSNQLNFQVAQGYNVVGCNTPGPSVCWGDGTTLGNWAHYVLIGTPANPPQRNTAQLVRCANNNETGAITGAINCTVGTYRVLANYAGNTDVFTYDTANKIVTINLQIQYNDPKIPNGRQSTPRLSSQVKLRN